MPCGAQTAVRASYIPGGTLLGLLANAADSSGFFVYSAVCPQPALVVQPLIISQAQLARQVQVVCVQSLRKRAQQHRHRQEGAGDLKQRKPFGVVAGDGHDR